MYADKLWIPGSVFHLVYHCKKGMCRGEGEGGCWECWQVCVILPEGFCCSSLQSWREKDCGEMQRGGCETRIKRGDGLQSQIVVIADQIGIRVLMSWNMI